MLIIQLFIKYQSLFGLKDEKLFSIFNQLAKNCKIIKIFHLTNKLSTSEKTSVLIIQTISLSLARR